MAHVSVDTDTSVPPAVVLNALTDFSDRRLELWPNIDRSYYKVHQVGEKSAEVTEGSRGVWERARYDWSAPGTVRIEVVDSNTFRPGSWWVYSADPRPGGGSHVHLEFERRPRSNLKGVLLGSLLALMGKKIFGDFLAETLRRLASRVPPGGQGAAQPSATPG